METEIKDRFLRRFKKEKSKKTYKSNINMFYDYILEKKSFDTDEELLKNIGFKDVEDYFYSIDEEGRYKKSTVNLKIEVLKEFFDYAIDNEIMISNLTKPIKKYSDYEIKEDKTEKYIPTIQEIKRLIDSTYDKKIDGRCQEFNNARDRFFISLLACTGIRVDEALGIEMNDIESVSNGCYMININGKRVKNGMSKRVPISQSIIKYFEEYKIQRMIRNEKFNSNLLFFGMRGKQMSGNKTNEAIEEYSQRANINGHITNHCFRHFLTEYLRSKGYDIGLVYKIMGWSEKGIITNYHGKATSKTYDELKLKMCDVLG
jgi:site-specific recombinase XerD